MPSEALNSWKEIAQYVDRGVRTLQRWELFYGFPVRRPAARDRSAVYALKSEVDEWLRTRATREQKEQAPSDAVKKAVGAASIRDRITELELELKGLRQQLSAHKGRRRNGRV